MAEESPTSEAAVTALLVAQDAFKDERGRTHIIGIFDSIEPDLFPVNVSFLVFCGIKGSGAHTAFVRIEDPEGNKVIETEPVRVEITPEKGHNLKLRFAVTLRMPGLYKVLAFLDDSKQVEHPLNIGQPPPTQG